MNQYDTYDQFNQLTPSLTSQITTAKITIERWVSYHLSTTQPNNEKNNYKPTIEPIWTTKDNIYGLRNIKKNYGSIKTKVEESGEHTLIGTG